MVARVQQQAFLRDVQDALDMGETEADALEVTAKALRDAAPGPGRAARRRRQPRPPPPRRHRAGQRGAGLRRSRRRGAARPFARAAPSTSSAATTCRPARASSDRGGEPCSAVCVPITILGTPDRRHPRHRARRAATLVRQQSIDRLEGVAAQVGTRLGVLRAMAKSQLQAETDPLTGLLNRRAMEERVRHLREAATPFALAMADLDHFKRLNDSYGHDTGDRALRTFARVLREAVRDNDVVARHGGEEFVVVLPGIDALTAAPVLHRIRDKPPGRRRHGPHPRVHRQHRRRRLDAGRATSPTSCGPPTTPSWRPRPRAATAW